MKEKIYSRTFQLNTKSPLNHIFCSRSKKKKSRKYSDDSSSEDDDKDLSDNSEHSDSDRNVKKSSKSKHKVNSMMHFWMLTIR